MEIEGGFFLRLTYSRYDSCLSESIIFPLGRGWGGDGGKHICVLSDLDKGLGSTVWGLFIANSSTF